MSLPVRAPAADDLALVRLAERLAIVDEVHDDIAHELAVATIHLGMLDPEGRGRAAGAPGVAQVACRRSLDGVRRARRRLAAAQGRDDDARAAAPVDAERLEALAAACGAVLLVTAPDPGAPPPGAGLRLSAARIAEALVRLTAHRSAVVEVVHGGGAACVSAASTLPRAAWDRSLPDLERVRERVRWFDGQLLVEDAAGGGSRVVATLPG